MLIPISNGFVRADGSVGAAAGAEGGRDKHKTQHHDGHLVRGVASQIVLVHHDGHPDPSEEGECVTRRRGRRVGMRGFNVVLTYIVDVRK